MKRTYFSTVFVLSAGLLVIGCQKSKGPVVAEVGSEKITLGDIQMRLADAPPAYQHYIASPTGRKEFLNLIIREKVVLTEARRSGLDKEDSFKKEIGRFEQNVQRQLIEYKDNLLVESYLRKLRSKDLAVTDADVQKYFDEHRNLYEHPVELQASHILVETREQAEAILAQLKAGQPFEKLAKENSKDPASAANGGKLPPFRHGTLVPEFENAAFALTNAQLSQPVQTQFGFHIIKKAGSKNLPPRPYADAKEDIRRMLERTKFDQWVKERQAKLKVRIDEPTAALLSATTPPTQEQPQ